MQITIDQEEITAFVENGIRTQFGFGDNQNISIDFTMGRTPNGLSAALSINAIGTKTVVAPAEPKAAPAPVTAAAETATAPAAVDQAPAEEIVDAQPEPAAAKTSVFSKATPAAQEETPEPAAEETKARPALFTKAG